MAGGEKTLTTFSVNKSKTNTIFLTFQIRNKGISGLKVTERCANTFFFLPRSIVNKITGFCYLSLKAAVFKEQSPEML